MFIVSNLIIGHTQKCHIYTQTERGNRLGARKTERECMRDREWLKIELVSVVKTAVGERLTILGYSRIMTLRLQLREKLF